MKSIKIICYAIAFLFSIQTAAVAQSDNISEIFKEHINKTAQEVKSTDNPDEKRALLNDSFERMLTAIEKIETRASLTEAELARLEAMKVEIEDRSNQLNGLDGYDEVMDEDLDDFNDYSQQSMEQARRTITISVTTLLLVIIILLLL